MLRPSIGGCPTSVGVRRVRASSTGSPVLAEPSVPGPPISLRLRSVVDGPGTPIPAPFPPRSRRSVAVVGFTRRIENFDCVVCGAHNRGDGYTNHCSVCLNSLHVDVDPGDRADECRGVMRPVTVEVLRGKYVIVHRCERCGVVRRCKAGSRDDVDTIHDVMRMAAEGALREDL